MTRDNLTPEQRPTKDGNLVTRWVRKDKKQSASTSSIPAPGIATTDRAAEKAERKKRAEEFVAKHSVPKDETKEQKTERKAKNKNNWGYLRTEAKLRFKHRNDDSIDDFEVNNLFKHLSEAGTVDPKSIDENLLRDYSAFKKAVWKPFFDERANDDYTDVDTYRPNTDKVGAHYANHPEDRAALTEIVGRGIADYDAVITELNKQK